MIDIEREVFFPIADKIRQEFNGAFVSGEYVKSPPSFPHVSIVEEDNYMTSSHMDTSPHERFATIMYEVNVYSNKRREKKSECRAIMQLIDEMMYDLNFTRLSMNPIPNLEDATIYRIVAQYRAETDGESIYRI